ncbi:hypothetical protein ACIPX0_26490 [Streptomyces sp. NPDC090075]|uniref:hypothetical protein n=1 Tax=Streptomyces sp. NPDC090075 TaxID=3365937 RepID=UPI00380D64D6
MVVPDNVVRCVKCSGPIESPGDGPHKCADCGRYIYLRDGLIRPGYHWRIVEGWLTSVETVDIDDE